MPRCGLSRNPWGPVAFAVALAACSSTRTADLASTRQTDHPAPSSTESGVTSEQPDGAVRPAFDASSGQPILVDTWSPLPAPAACINALPSPIPGCDPDRNPTWDLDCDLDGVPDHIAYGCDPSTAELAPMELGYDCAPDNPLLNQWISQDADADGYFASGDLNCSGKSVPPGYAAGVSYNDCDDSSASVFPGAPDTWGDGIDSDCTNGDAPSCAVLDSGVQIATDADADTRCGSTPNLRLDQTVICPGAARGDFRLYVLISNTGSVASSEGVILSWTGETGTSGEVAIESISPHATTQPIRILYATDARRETLTLSLSSVDCLMDDNLLRIPIGVCPRCA